MSLKQQAVSGLKWTSVAAITAATLQLLQLLVLARLLEKEDFGLMALAMVLVGLAQLFADLGLANTLIHKKDVTREQLHTIYGINLITGICLYVLLFFAAPGVSAFYGNTELTNIIRWLSLIFVIQPFGQLYHALLRKKLQFNAIAKRDIAAKVINFCACILAALCGYGVYSFVIAQVLGTCISTILLISFGRKLYIPQLHISKNDIKPFLSYSLYLLGENIVSFTRNQIDILLIGKIMTIELVGIYNMAKRIVEYPFMLFNPVVLQVSFPVMAKVQDEPARLKNIYLKAINYLASVSFPVYAFIALFACVITTIMLGGKWLSVVPILPILCMYAALRLIYNPISSLLFAKGFFRRSFWWNVGFLIVTPACLLLAFLWETKINGIAWGTVTGYAIIIIPMWYFLIRPCIPCKLGEYLQQFVRPILASIIIAALCIPVILWISTPIIQLAAGCFVFLVAFIPVARLINPAFYTELVLQLKDIWNKKHI